MKSIRTVLAAIRRADQQFNLIQPGDKIIIGVSGGKDSLLLTYALSLYSKFSHTDFTLQPVILDLGFLGFDPEPLKAYIKSLGLELRVENCQDVYKILKIQQKDADHLPCSICSRMKKAAINKTANELGFNKVAFAHHADDAIETLFMNEVFGGRIATFSPKMTLDRANIVFIRPFILLHETEISAAVKELKIPVQPSACPADKHTIREETKKLLHEVYLRHPYAKANFLSMLTNYDHAGTWFGEFSYQVAGTALTVSPVLTKNDALAMFDIRHRVFIDEQKVPFDIEMDGSDVDAKNFLLYEKGKPIGTIRYIEHEKDFHIGRFCILKEYRGKGYGKSFISWVEDQIKEKNTPCVISLHAQQHAQEFYEKLGYIPEGEIFYEAGIPHIAMKKNV